MNHVNYTRYDAKNRPTCVILCQHGDDGRKFLTRFPDFHKVCGISKELLERYLAVERDFGTGELAHAVARKVQERGYSVGVAEVLKPRGVVDPNRITGKCVQPLFDHEKNQSLVAQLTTEHATALGEVAEVLTSVNPIVLVDLHSMSSHTPRVDAESTVRAVKLVPGNVEAYLEAWLSAATNGERRYLDIVTHLNTDEVVADLRFAVKMAMALQRASVEYRFNHPYPTAKEVMTTEYLQKYPGVCLDVPKDYLAEGPLDGLWLNMNKVMKIAHAVAEAIAKYLEV